MSEKKRKEGREVNGKMVWKTMYNLIGHYETNKHAYQKKI